MRFQRTHRTRRAGRVSEQLLAHVIALADAAADVSDTAARGDELLNRAWLCTGLTEALAGSRSRRAP